MADEVGLGKTVVAREIVRRMAERKSGPTVVFYVSNGSSVATQNKSRVVEFLGAAERTRAVKTPDRLSLIAVTPGPKTSVVVYALTPHTSFPGVGATLTGGRISERAYVAVLLEKAYPSVWRAVGEDYMRLDATSGWPGAIAYAREKLKAAPPGLLSRFREALAEEFGSPLADDMRAVARGRPRAFIGRLRRALALASLRNQPPDLVIFDEFQRYRNILDEGGLANPLMRQLLVSGGGRGPALLFLSATPYRLFATRWEESRGAQAHTELFDLVEFLAGDATRTEAEGLFETFGETLREIVSAGEGDLAVLEVAVRKAAGVRDRLRELLEPVMARTERDAGLSPSRGDTGATPLDAPLRTEDVAVYRHLVKSFGDKQRAEALAYWSSVPLPAQSLGLGYAAWRKTNFKPMQGLLTINESMKRRLAAPPAWPDAKLRALDTAAPPEQLALPWVAPSLRWWPLKGGWAGPGDDPKLLMFSRFKATPPSVAALLSFGVEARWLRRDRGGYEIYARRRRLKLSDRPNPVMAAFHPSPWLIQNTDPLAAAGERVTPAALERRIRTQLTQALARLEPPVRIDRATTKARRRHRPIGTLLPALEQRVDTAGASADAWQVLLGTDQKAAKAIRAWRASPPLNSISPLELADLARYALSAPGIVAGRALHRHAPDALNVGYPALLRLCWHGLRAYLDNPVILAALGGDSSVDAVLSGVRDGNLESVLDEHFWIQAQGLSTAEALADDLRSTLNLVSGGFNFHPIGVGDRIRLRCHVAVPFGDAEAAPADAGEGEHAPARPDEVRKSFNTPFWPHILVTTSVGQEGLDFHPWCSRVAHWDLSSNPLDLEQREGRIQRYAGLVVRRGLAEKIGPDLWAKPTAVSPWIRLAALADANHGDRSGLRPWWILDGTRITRHIFVRPFGRDAARFAMLREQRLIYRLALGQPNQEDLLDILARGGEVTLERLRPLVLDLSAMGLRTLSDVDNCAATAI